MLELLFLYGVLVYYRHWFALFVCAILNMIQLFIYKFRAGENND